LEYDHQILSNMQQLIEDFIICSKINYIHKFILRMNHNENNVYTERGEFIFSATVKYELQKILFKLDNFQECCLNFNYNTTQ